MIFREGQGLGGTTSQCPTLGADTGELLIMGTTGGCGGALGGGGT